MPSNILTSTILKSKANLFPDEIQFLNMLFLNSGKYVIDKTSLDVSIDKNIHPTKLRIMLLSFKMPPTKGQVFDNRIRKRSKPFFDDKYKTVKYSNGGHPNHREIVDEVCSKISHHNEQNENDHIRFLLLNELAISFVTATDMMLELHSRLKSCTDKNGLIIIPGTYHCKDSYFNVAPVINTNMTLDSDYYEYATKQSSAEKQDEFVRTIDGTKLIRYRTPFGNIAILICLDLYNPNLILKLVRENMRLSIAKKPDGEAIDFLFVPSFNYDDEKTVDRMIRIISKYANVNLFSANGTAARVENGWVNNTSYGFGEPIKIIDEDKNDEYACTIYEIDTLETQKMQTRPLKNEFSSLFREILGMSNSGFQNI